MSRPPTFTVLCVTFLLVMRMTPVCGRVSGLKTLKGRKRVPAPAQGPPPEAQRFAWAWLLFDDLPAAWRVEAVVFLLQVEVPVVVQVAAEIEGAQLDHGL